GFSSSFLKLRLSSSKDDTSQVHCYCVGRGDRHAVPVHRWDEVPVPTSQVNEFSDILVCLFPLNVGYVCLHSDSQEPTESPRTIVRRCTVMIYADEPIALAAKQTHATRSDHK